MIQKCWHIAEKSLTYGAAHSYTAWVQNNDYIGPDMLIPYVKDVFFEPGKISNKDSNFIFMRSWYQPRDIKAIIHREKELKAKSKELGEDFTNGWDLKALAEIENQVTSKADKDISSMEQKKRDDTHRGGVEIIHAFQKGYHNSFYSYHPKSQKIVRTYKNKDPRGLIPIQTLYADTDGVNPLGWGIVEQVGSLQNLIDSEMQMYQFNRALSLAPPLIKRGTYPKSQIKLMPNEIIDLGNGQNNSLDALRIDTSALTNFPNNYGLMKSQLLNLTSSPDTSISAEVGNPGFSKTPAGIKAQQAVVGVDDNYYRKQFETWFEDWSEDALNRWFCEREGVEELQLDKKTADRIRKLAPELVSEDHKVTVDYKDAKEALEFEIDASSSHLKDDQQQIEAMDSLLERIGGSSLGQFVPPENILRLYNKYVHALGIEDPEEVIVDIEAMKQEQEEAQMQQEMQQQMQQEAQQQAPEMQGEMPPEMPEMPPEMMETPEEIAQEDPAKLQLIDELRNMGLNDDQISQALAMTEAGVEIEEILQILEVA